MKNEIRHIEQIIQGVEEGVLPPLHENNFPLPLTKGKGDRDSSTYFIYIDCRVAQVWLRLLAMTGGEEILWYICPLRMESSKTIDNRTNVLI
ncbi:hypothetical protein ACFLYQ_00490 [Chloroflexota bacterium]